MGFSVEEMAFSYSKNEILKNIGFSLDNGDYLAVLGTNGTGKSTLLKCISKILSPKKGLVYIDDICTREISGIELAKNMGYVPQTHEHSRKTVFESVLLGRKPYIKWDITQNDLDITEEVIKLLNLEAYSMRYTTELSGGELQKVIIARALAQEPKVLLMDEPTSNLDLRNQIEVLSTIKDIVEKKNISVVVAMHDLNLALRYANKFLLLKDGEVFDFGDSSVLTEEAIKDVYGVDVVIEEFQGLSVVIPL